MHRCSTKVEEGLEKDISIIYRGVMIVNSRFMEKYNRLEKAVNFQPVDRIPYADWVQNQDVIEHYSHKSTRKNFWTVDQVYMMADKCMDLVQEFTPAYVPDAYFPNPQDLYGIFGDGGSRPVIKVKEYKKDTWIAEDEEGFVWEYNYWTRWIIKKPFDSYSGAVKYLSNKTQEILDFRNRIDWKKYADGFHGTLRYNIEKSSTPQLYMTPFGGLGFDILYLIIGWEYLSQMLYCEDRNVIKDYVNACTALALDWIKHSVSKEYSPIALIYSDIGHKKGLLISPKLIEEILLNSIATLANEYHKKGIKVIYHSEGNIRKVLEMFIESGVDGINPLEWYSDMEIVKIRREYPGLILYGGIDDGTLLRKGTLEEVESYVKYVIREIGKESGLLLGSSGEIHPACAKENTVKMIDTIINTRVE